MDAKKIIDTLKKMEEKNPPVYEEIKKFMMMKPESTIAVEIEASDKWECECPKCGYKWAENEFDAKEKEVKEIPDSIDNLEVE